MNKAVQIIIPALLVVIALLILYTGRKAKKFEAQHTGVYKTMVRGLESLLLLAFAAVALLTLKGAVSPVTGIILMAVTFVFWLPFKALLYTMLSLDEEGITHLNPMRGTTEIPWQDVNSVSVSKSSIMIKSGDESIRVCSYFTGYEKIKETIKEKCPKAFK